MKLMLFFIVFLPNKLKIFAYKFLCGFKIGKNVKIGFSYIAAKKVCIGDNVSIGHGNIIKGITFLQMKSFSSIANGNWITGFPDDLASPHFASERDRVPGMFIGMHSAITSRHIIDCTNSFSLGDYSTLAGFRSQILTHSINVKKSIQESKPVCVGNYCFLGTSIVILPGSRVPDGCLVAAGSVVNSELIDSGCMYAGVPAKKIKNIGDDYLYFKRISGYVV